MRPLYPSSIPIVTPRRPMPLPITVIHWSDCFSPCSGPWVAVDDPVNSTEDTLTIVTVGYVFKETEHYVSVCSSLGLSEVMSGDFEDSSVSGIMHIPCRQIDKRVELDVQALVEKAKGQSWMRKVRKGRP